MEFPPPLLAIPVRSSAMLPGTLPCFPCRYSRICSSKSCTLTLLVATPQEQPALSATCPRAIRFHAPRRRRASTAGLGATAAVLRFIGRRQDYHRTPLKQGQTRLFPISSLVR